MNEYSQNGYLPEALINFIALLGWSSPLGDELMTKEQLLDQFDLDRMNPAPAVFDETKLKWMNGQHLRKLSHQELWSRILPFLEMKKSQ